MESRKYVIKDYFTGKVIKTITCKNPNRSTSFNVEENTNGRKFVVRDYYTNKVLQTASIPNVSVEFFVK